MSDTNHNSCRREYDVLQQCSSLAHRVELAHQRMGGIDFVVPVGTDQQQMLTSAVSDVLDCGGAILKESDPAHRRVGSRQAASERKRHKREGKFKIKRISLPGVEANPQGASRPARRKRATEPPRQLPAMLRGGRAFPHQRARPYRRLRSMHTSSQGRRARRSIEPALVQHSVLHSKFRARFAVSTGKFMCDGNEIMGISTQAPIYAELEGKRAGDAISFNGRELVIEEVA